MEIPLKVAGPVHDRGGEQAGPLAPGRMPEPLPSSLKWLRVSGDLRELDWRVFLTLMEPECLSLAHGQERPEGTSALRPWRCPPASSLATPTCRGSYSTIRNCPIMPRSS